MTAPKKKFDKTAASTTWSPAARAKRAATIESNRKKREEEKKLNAQTLPVVFDPNTKKPAIAYVGEKGTRRPRIQRDDKTEEADRRDIVKGMLAYLMGVKP